MCVLSDHQPANHQEIERLNVGEITEGVTVNTVIRNEHCAQAIISELEDRRAQINSTESDTEMFDVKNEHCAQSIISELEDARTQITNRRSNTMVIEAEIHAENTDTQHMVHFEEAQDSSDAGSLITQAPQSNTIHATINALSTWMSAIQPRESWYLAGWIGDSPIDFLVDPGAVISAISLQCYDKLVETNAYTHAFEGHALGVRSRQQIRHESTRNVQIGIISTWTINQHRRSGRRFELSGHPRYGHPRGRF